MIDQANVLRELMRQRNAQAVPEAPAERSTRCRTIAVTSGKGGVGKTNIALNLAVSLARSEARVCLLDANLGLGNVDLLCRLNGYWNLSHVISGARRLDEVLLEGPAGIDVIPGAGGLTDVADCSPAAQNDVLLQLQEMEANHDVILIDTGVGLHRTVRGLLDAADTVLAVTTPEPTAVAATYATIKALAAQAAEDVQVIVNRVESTKQAALVFERLKHTAERFAHISLESAGTVPEDPQVPRAVANRHAFITAAPHSPAAQAIDRIARRLRRVDRTELRTGFFANLCERLRTRGCASAAAT